MFLIYAGNFLIYAIFDLLDKQIVSCPLSLIYFPCCFLPFLGCAGADAVDLDTFVSALPAFSSAGPENTDFLAPVVFASSVPTLPVIIYLEEQSKWVIKWVKWHHKYLTSMKLMI